MNLQGKRVIVTGAGDGMGKATALEYGKQGSSVLVADLDGVGAHRTVEEIRSVGGSAETFQMDLRSRGDVEGMIDHAVTRFGGLDILANVGAIYPHMGFAEMTEDFWNNVFDIDLKGALFACQAALPHLKESQGAIVNVASGAAFYAIPGLAAYGAAKAGLVALGRSIALEASPDVRVNTVLPGPTAPPERARDDFPNPPPLLGRQLLPAEVADVIVWVSSDAASAVNGALLRVDGGYRMI